MTNALDDEIRRMMGQLLQRAPIAPTVQELRARSFTESPRTSIRSVAVAAAAAVLVGAMVVPQLVRKSSTQVATEGLGSSLDVSLDRLTVSYIPAGFVPTDDRTETVPASFVQSEGSIPGSEIRTPTGSLGTRRVQQYSKIGAGARPGSAVIYVTVSFTPDHVTTVDELTMQVPNATGTSVAGKPAVIGRNGLVELRWLESPHVVVLIVARGAVDESEVRRVAESVTFR